MWLKKYNTLPEGLPPLNSSPLEDDTSWLKKYANGGRVGNPPPRKLKLNPNYQPKPMGYYSTLKQPEVSESTGVQPQSELISQANKTKDRIEYVHEKSEDIRKRNPQYSEEVINKLAEDNARLNFDDRESPTEASMQAYNQTEAQKERDRYLFKEGMHTREMLRYPLQFLAGEIPTEEEVFQERLRYTDPTKTRAQRFEGTVNQALDLAPSALGNTAVGLAFAPANYSKVAKVLDAVSPVGYTPKIKNYVGGAGNTIKEGAGKVTGKSYPKSEIDWSKWNKEIPENKALMREYEAIEKSAKANGTWMKNPDGSAFKGTPEQFVQQNSENFKKAFPNPILDKDGNIQINYHGSPQKFDSFKETNKPGEIGTGLYTTTNKKYAEAFANNYNERVVTGETRNPTIYELYQNSNNPQNVYKEYDKFKDEAIAQFKKQTRFLPKSSGKYKKLDKELYKLLTGTHEEIFKKGLNNLTGGYDSLTKGHQTVVPFKNLPKSSIGNNGMFDMSNPNIYKSLIPALVGTGVIESLTIPSKEGDKEYKTGGWLKNY